MPARSTHRTLVALLALVGVAGMVTACWSLTADRDGVFGPARADASAPPTGLVPAADAGDAGDAAAALPFCARADASADRIMCLDFDVEGAVIDSENGGRYSLREADRGGRELLFEASAGADGPRAFVVRAVPGRAATAHVGMDVAVDSVPGNGAATAIITLLFRNGSGYYEVAAWLSDGPTVAVAHGGSIGPEGFLYGRTVLVRGQRYRFDFDVTFAGAGAAAVLALDGREEARIPIGPVPEPDPLQTVLQLGMSVGPPSPTRDPTRFTIDNVLYDLTTR